MRQVGALIEKMRNGEQFSQRHHNPYLEEAIALQGILYTPTELGQQNYQGFTLPGRSLILEIGCYLGRTILEMATAHPEVEFFGIDLTYKRTVKCARKIKKAGLANARIGISEARQFLNSIPDASLDGVCMFFPDPWPKKGDEKHRLVREDLFEIMSRKIKVGGFYWLKTDHLPHMERALSSAEQFGWSISEENVQPAPLSDRPYSTVFEELFISQGLPIYRRVFTNPGRGVRSALEMTHG